MPAVSVGKRCAAVSVLIEPGARAAARRRAELIMPARARVRLAAPGMLHGRGVRVTVRCRAGFVMPVVAARESLAPSVLCRLGMSA